MNEKDIINMIKSDDSLKVDEKLWNNIENKIRDNEGSTFANKGKKHMPVYRYALVSSCFAAILLMVIILPNLNKLSIGNKGRQVIGNLNKASIGVGHNVNGIARFAYYRYDSKYYKAEYPDNNTDDQISKDFEDIQNKIVKRLYNNFFEISGVDPSKSIALFDGRYYYKLDYAFEDFVPYNGKQYLISPIEGPDPNTLGKYLGKAGNYDVYQLTDSDPSEKVALKLNPSDSNYCIAYQLFSTVVLNGTTYEVQPGLNPIQDNEKVKYLGDAGPYKAYGNDSYDPSQPIILHVNDKLEAVANPITGSMEENVPKSMYGSPFESMYPVICNIQWNHMIYQLGSFNYVNKQGEIIKQIGRKLGKFTFDDVTYYIYEIKGVDPSKSVAVKNNEVYIIYDFLLNSIVKYNGGNYEISTTGGSGIRGSEIGNSGSNTVYSIKGTDSSKEIIVLIDRTTWTAYRMK